jgi:hypothetical protein
MMTWQLLKLGGTWIGIVGMLVLLPGPRAGAQGTFADPAFQTVWERSDKPVAEGRAGGRSWTWGPQARQPLREPYSRNVFGGDRLVQYFDKARMEINNPNGDRNNLYFVTNGRLVVEMISGRVQTGDNSYDNRLAAEIPVSGDNTPANKDAPTYATLYNTANIGGVGPDGAQVTGGLLPGRSLDRSGALHNVSLASVACPPRTPNVNGAVAAATWVPQTKHNIPKVFWDFLNQRGPIYVNGSYQNGPVVDWVFAMGYPITEPYWVKTVVGTRSQWVLFQAFERRILTYTPCNEAAFQVEMGNVGLHYYDWRYGTASAAREAQVLDAVAPADVCPEAQAAVCPFVPAVPSSSRIRPTGQARTGAEGSMDLQTRTTVIRLLDNGFVQFRAITDPITQVAVELGRIFAAHDPNGHDVITVDTGSAVVVALDTHFSVQATRQDLYVNVRDGKGVTVTLKNQNTVLVPGQQTRFARAATTIPPPEPMDPAEAGLWDEVIAHWRTVPGVLRPALIDVVPLPDAPVQTAPPVGGPPLGCGFDLAWDPIGAAGAATYTVELEQLVPNTKTYTPWQRVERITATRYAIAFASDTSFTARWRVWASVGGVVGAASPWQDFQVQCIA